MLEKIGPVQLNLPILPPLLSKEKAEREPGLPIVFCSRAATALVRRLPFPTGERAARVAGRGIVRQEIGQLKVNLDWLKKKVGDFE
jgi:hypothetical protein